MLLTEVGHTDEAKRWLSELLRRAEHEPQIILNRDRPVAAVISGKNLQEFLTWRERRTQRSLADSLAEVRRIFEEEGYDLVAPKRSDRPNPLLPGRQRVPGRHERRQRADAKRP